MAGGSGFPSDRAGPVIRRGEIDYDSQMAEFRNGLRFLRWVSTCIVVVFGLVAIVLAVTGRADTALGLLGLLVAPFALLLALVEGVALLRRRGRSN